MKSHSPLQHCAAAILCVLLTLASEAAPGAQKKAVKATNPSPTTEAAIPVESVLDRLEKQMIEQDQEGLSFAKKPKNVDGEKPNTIFKFEKKTIGGSTQESHQLREVGLTVTELENQVDSLAQEVQRARQKVLEDIKFRNAMDITLSIEQPDLVSVRQLEISLDGFALYAIDDVAGLWIPSRIFPVYSGPIDAGTHKLKLSGKLVGRIGENSTSPRDKVLPLESEFQLTVSPNPIRQKYEIVIHTLAKSAKGATAELIEKSN